MADDGNINCNATVTDAIERVRSERFPEVDRDLVLEVLRIHADGVVPENVSRLVDEIIAKHTPVVD